MSGALTIAFTPRATNETRRALAWWRENRPAAPTLFEEELQSVMALVATAPSIGALAADPRVRGVRRVYLRRTRYHVYYRVEAQSARLEVLAVWHAKRREPSL